MSEERLDEAEIALLDHLVRLRRGYDALAEPVIQRLIEIRAMRSPPRFSADELAALSNIVGRMPG